MQKIGRHKIRKRETLDLATRLEKDYQRRMREEERSYNRQMREFKKQSEEFKKLGESGRAFAVGTYKTAEQAYKVATRLGTKASRSLKGLFARFRGKQVTRPAVQVFVTPTDEGNYAVYGQVKREEVPIKRPARPIKVYVPEKKREEKIYGEW